MQTTTAWARILRWHHFKKISRKKSKKKNVTISGSWIWILVARDQAPLPWVRAMWGMKEVHEDLGLGDFGVIDRELGALIKQVSWNVDGCRLTSVAWKESLGFSTSPRITLEIKKKLLLVFSYFSCVFLKSKSQNADLLVCNCIKKAPHNFLGKPQSIIKWKVIIICYNQLKMVSNKPLKVIEADHLRPVLCHFR